MIFGLLKRSPQKEPAAAEIVYAAIVAAARRPAFYDRLAAPDTLPGRFELIVLHVALFLRRLRRDGDQTRAFGQAIFDEMFRSLESALREIGVGDMSVPKRMKAMARSFYDGAAVYDAALDAADAAALTRAVRRIVYRDAPAAESAPDRLARYAIRADESLARQPLEALLTQGPAFPAPEEASA